ncbi:MAG TPA: VOC family protein [Streptosporangiaceae bacterium]|nr:VOC family protein [Streptosporangiaceae bacterium]
MTEITGNAANGTPTWVDLGIPDLGRAEEFYGAVFGWEFEEGPPETGRYTMCLLRGHPVAAIMPNPDPGADTSWWNTYFATDDCDGAAKRIADAGGSVVMEPMDVMDSGRMVMALDPHGAQFGLWHGNAHSGTRFRDEPGSLTWTELETPDSKAATEFYGAVLQRPIESMGIPDFDYSTVNVDGNPVAGIWGQPERSSARWMTYFAVADADATVGVATEAGGTVERPAQDSPYGRFAVLKDPFGASFAVMVLPENPPT